MCAYFWTAILDSKSTVGHCCPTAVRSAPLSPYQSLSNAQSAEAISTLAGKSHLWSAAAAGAGNRHLVVRMCDEWKISVT